MSKTRTVCLDTLLGAPVVVMNPCPKFVEMLRLIMPHMYQEDKENVLYTKGF